MQTLKFKKTMTGIVALTLTAGLAIFLGVNAGNLYNDWKASEIRTENTNATLERMGTLNIGDTLPDHTFEYLDRKKVKLSELIKGNTLITFISPNCPNCDDQLEALSGTAPVEIQSQRVVLISPHNPRFLEEIRDKHDIIAPLLYDHRREYWSLLRINSYPINVFVNGDRQIEDILVGALVAEDFEKLLKEGSFFASAN